LIRNAGMFGKNVQLKISNCCESRMSVRVVTEETGRRMKEAWPPVNYPSILGPLVSLVSPFPLAAKYADELPALIDINRVGSPVSTPGPSEGN
jgi:hypothetical protein